MSGAALTIVAWVVIALLGAAVLLAAGNELRGVGGDPADFSRPAIDEAAILWAIRQRESGDNPQAIGDRFGERSAYQFTAARWRELTGLPFRIATSNPKMADLAGRKNLRAIRADLKRRGLEELPEFIGAAWNYGPHFALSAARTEYARAVAALYWDRLKGADAK